MEIIRERQSASETQQNSKLIWEGVVNRSKFLMVLKTCFSIMCILIFTYHVGRDGGYLIGIFMTLYTIFRYIFAGVIIIGSPVFLVFIAYLAFNSIKYKESLPKSLNSLVHLWKVPFYFFGLIDKKIKVYSNKIVIESWSSPRVLTFKTITSFENRDNKYKNYIKIYDPDVNIGPLSNTDSKLILSSLEKELGKSQVN